MKYSGADKITYNVLIGLLLILLVNSCKRNELPEDVVDPAVFEMEGTINGEPISITAGEKGYYMHSSFAMDAQNILHFKGSLKPLGCTVCGKFFEIDISNYVEGSSYDINQAIVAGNYPFAGEDTLDIGYQVKFINKSPTPAGSTFGWGLPGDTSNSAVLNYVFAQKGIYQVRLTSQNAGCFSTIVNNVYVGVNEPICRTRINVIRVTPDSVIFVAHTNGRGTRTFDYFWDFGDGTKVDTRLLQLHKKYATNDNFQVRLLTRDTLQTCSDTTRININTAANPLCEANFDNEQAREVHTEILSRITVTYTDSAGVVYSSAENTQSPGSIFRLKSVKDYQNNERGEKTKLVECEFTGNLFNSIFGTIRVENMKAKIAIAYP